MFRFLRREHHYSHLKNVRVHRQTMVVERLYIVAIRRSKDGRGSIAKTEWREVDYKTTHDLKAGCRPCPEWYLKTLLRTAF